MFEKVMEILLELSLRLEPLFMFIIMVSAIIVGVFYEHKLKMLRNEKELQKLTLLRERLEVIRISRELDIDANAFKDILGINVEENVTDKT